jgi:hypothetical protein
MVAEHHFVLLLLDDLVGGRSDKDLMTSCLLHFPMAPAVLGIVLQPMGQDPMIPKVQNLVLLVS